MRVTVFNVRYALSNIPKINMFMRIIKKFQTVNVTYPGTRSWTMQGFSLLIFSQNNRLSHSWARFSQQWSSYLRPTCFVCFSCRRYITNLKYSNYNANAAKYRSRLCIQTAIEIPLFEELHNIFYVHTQS